MADIRNAAELFVCSRRDDIYTDAEAFRPERFLEKDVETNPYKFAPFLYGSRQCLGYRFALVEMRLMLAILLRNFRFELDSSSPNYRRSQGLVMRPDPSLKLRVSLASDRVDQSQAYID
jgi:cytochrome P450